MDKEVLPKSVCSNEILRNNPHKEGMKNEIDIVALPESVPNQLYFSLFQVSNLEQTWIFDRSLILSWCWNPFGGFHHLYIFSKRNNLYLYLLHACRQFT